MKEIIKRFLTKWSCSHKWEFIKERSVKVTYFEDGDGGRYHRQLFICKECGKFKDIKF